MTDFYAKTNVIDDLSQAYEFATVAEFKASLIEFPDGKVINLLDRGAEFIKITGTGTANAFNIIASTGVDQSIVYEPKNGVIYSGSWGLAGVVDETIGLQTFLQSMLDNNYDAIIDAKNYLATGQLVLEVAEKNFSLHCPVGSATIKIDAVIDRVIEMTECLSCRLENVDFDLNEKCGMAVSLRTTNSKAKDVKIVNCTIFSCQQTTQSVNATAFFVLGPYDRVNIDHNKITSCERVDASLFTQAIVVFGATGQISTSYNKISNVHTPDNKDADAIAVFGAMNGTPTELDIGSWIAEGNILTNIQGRCFKSQHSNTIIEGNTCTLLPLFTTITNWNFADFQMSNGKCLNNHLEIMNDIDLTSGSYCQFQNLKDVSRKESIFSGNTLSGTSKIPFVILSGIANGETSILVDGNPIATNAVFCKHTGVTGDFTSAFYSFTDNMSESKGNFFEGPSSSFSNLLVKIVDNTNTDTNTLNFRNSILLNGIDLGTNFVLKNNKGFKDEVSWAFDADNLNHGNTFIVQSQSNSNDPAGIGTGAHWEVEGFKQKAVTDTGVTEFMRTSVDYGVNWGVWRSVTYT